MCAAGIPEVEEKELSEQKVLAKRIAENCLHLSKTQTYRSKRFSESREDKVEEMCAQTQRNETVAFDR